MYKYQRKIVEYILSYHVLLTNKIGISRKKKKEKFFESCRSKTLMDKLNLNLAVVLEYLNIPSFKIGRNVPDSPGRHEGLLTLLSLSRTFSISFYI